MPDRQIAWKMICDFYGEQRAKRSDVPLINHIIEGVAWLDHTVASEYTIAAFMLHPLVQRDPDLQDNWKKILQQEFDATTIMFLMEYRNIANGYLPDASKPNIFPVNSPIPAVNDMLRADKIQNRKDFLAYYDREEMPERAKLLDQYFDQWLEVLGVGEPMYRRAISVMAKAT